MNRRLMLLATVAVVLAGVAAWQDGRLDGVLSLIQPPAVSPPAPEGPVPSPVKTAEGTPVQKAPLNPLERLSAAELAAIVDKPLFSPGRRPRPAEPPPVETPPPVEEPVVEAPPAEEGPKETDFTLLAIASGPNARVAALRINATSEVVYVRQGYPVLNWQVLEVGDRDISIGDDTASVKLSLFAGKYAPVAAPVPVEGEDGAADGGDMPPPDIQQNGNDQ